MTAYRDRMIARAQMSPQSAEPRERLSNIHGLAFLRPAAGCGGGGRISDAGESVAYGREAATAVNH
jgi:hypothetical protein